jgi:predicted Fe-Mo cluster-binding NifX family protein
MKIAAASEDGVTISQHLGRAPFYVVLTVKDDTVILRERRDKMGHAQFADEPHGTHGAQAGPGHGSGPEAHNRHARMAETIADCDVLLAGGMGAGAYESLWHVGVRPLITDVADIDEAVKGYLAGTLTDHVEKLH